MTREVHAYYRDTLDACAEGEVSPPRTAIREPEDVWRYVQLGDELWVQRAPNGRWFVSIECGCDWEPEHGLQLVLEDGARVTKVGPYDGHLTNAAAYADPTLEGVVYVGER